MTLHRDIYWLGRQWAVTGLGIQAVDKKLDGQFDIGVSRIWEDDLAAPMESLDWFDAADFANVVAAARKRAKERPVVFQPTSTGER